MSMTSPGYFNLTEGNYGFGMGIISRPFTHHFAGISTVNGYRFGNGMTLGLGVGWFQYNEGWLLPVYIDGRYFLGNQRVKFFLMADGGMLYDIKHPYEKFRVFGNPGVGLTIPVAQNFQLSFSTGLFAQWTNFFDRRDSYINMKLGLLFGK